MELMNEQTYGIYLIYGAIMLGGALAIGLWKGRVLASLLWSGFLGPIGWVIVALGPNMNAVKSVDCPHCGKTLPVAQPACNHCGNQISWIAGKARKPSRAA